MVKKIAYKVLWNLSLKLGYEIHEKNISPKKTYGNDPRELLYIQDLPYAILHLPTALGVGLRFFPLTGKTYHPFVLALRNVGPSKSCEEAVFEILKMYNRLSTLKNPNDYLGLNDIEAFFSTSSHPLEYAFPWSLSKPHEVKQKALEDIIQENGRYGLATDESLELSPASDEKIRIETSRLLSLENSIRKNGFKATYSDPLGCFVLVNGDEWKWYVRGGQHRASVMAALGYAEIPVFVRRIIKREDVCYWPNVQSGVYTEKQALTVFDKLFQSEPPPVAKEWVEYVNKTFGYKTPENYKTG